MISFYDYTNENKAEHNLKWPYIPDHPYRILKVMSATFLLVCFVCLKESTFETRKNVFYFTLEALYVLEIIRF